MVEKSKQKKSRLDAFARVIQITTGLSIIVGIIVGIASLYHAHKQAKMAFRTMRLSSLQYINVLIDTDTQVRKNIANFLADFSLGIINPKELLEKYGTGERVYLSKELNDFRDIFRHYEQLGAKVKLQYIDMDLIYEVIPFPDKFWDSTSELRCVIQYNWYGKGKELVDFGSNFNYLKEFYDQQRGEVSVPFNDLLSAFSKKIKGTNQVIFVVNEELTSYQAKVYAVEKQSDQWQMVFRPMGAFIGENGFAMPRKKREGDYKTPTGIFSLKRSFGYYSDIGTKMQYQQVTDDDIWINNVHSADYNKWVKKSETKEKQFEKMKRDDNLYKYGIVIEYNTNPVQKGIGSAIFFHVCGCSCTTSGCVALKEEDLLRILNG